MKQKRLNLILIFLLFFLLYLADLDVYSYMSTGLIVSQERQTDFLSNRPLVSVPLTFDGRVLIPLRINGSEEIDIILDTGINSKGLLLLYKELGEQLGLKYTRTVNAARGAGSGPPRAIHICPGVDITLSQINLGSLMTAVLDESCETSARHNKGVIGASIFNPYVVKIDFDTSRVSLYEPESYQKEEGWEEIPLILERNLPVIETTISINDSEEIPVRLCVDTGAKPTLGLSINEEKQIIQPSKVVYSLTSTAGLRGDTYNNHGRISGVKVGQYRLKDVISCFIEGDEMPLLEEIQCDGLIGVGSLYRFNMIFDYTHKRMFIKPNKHFPDPFEMNMAGMAIVEMGSGAHVVYYVIENFLASKQGLRKGDILEKVNGKDVDSFNYLKLRKIFEKEGKTVTVQIRRAGKSQKIKLKLKRII